jgi:hypothetical protein
MKDQFSQVAQRTRRWKFDAGTTELIIGGMLFSGGLALALPRTPTFALVIFLPGIFLIGTLEQYLERRYVYPRIGYVEYHENTGKGIWRLLLIMVASLVVLGGVLAFLFEYQPDNALAWITPLLAFYISAVLVPYAIQMKIRRLTLLGLISAALGLTFSPLVLGRGQTAGLFGLASLGFYLLAMGLVFLFSGACAFRMFLRRTPLPKEEPDEQ